MNAGRRAGLRPARGVAAVVAVTALSLVGAGAGVAAAAPGPAAPAARAPLSASAGRWIVRFRPGAAAQLERRVVALGGRVVAVQGALDTLVAELPDGAAAALRAAPEAIGVSPDAAARPMALGFDPATQPGALTNVARITGAGALWAKGYTGAGVDVAVVDTGVSPVPALADATKVVVGPDLSFESQVPSVRYLDTFGHGTAMASIIAGREGAKASGATYAATSRTTFYGMAPDARVLSLKLADRNGTVDVSQLIAGIDWVVAHRKSDGLNIRVLNLSFGTDSAQNQANDPLSWAAETAWRNGIVVVASAGNDGQRALGLADPAYNTKILAVGAVDTKGTDAVADDSIPAFSAHLNPTGVGRCPDLVAPGVGVLGAGAPGSTLVAAYPAARFGNGYLRGSGTSQAAAVVSGGAALLLQQRPTLTPDQVRSVLLQSVTPLAGVDYSQQGYGELNLVAAAAATPRGSGKPASAPANNDTGTLEGARGSLHVVMDGVALTGEKDVLGGTWDRTGTALSTAGLTIWSADGRFNGTPWIGGALVADVSNAAGQTWGGRTWSGRTWSGRTWSGRTWSSLNWNGATFNGRTWSSAGWVDSAGGWAGALWSGAGWG